MWDEVDSRLAIDFRDQVLFQVFRWLIANKPLWQMLDRGSDDVIGVANQAYDQAFADLNLSDLLRQYPEILTLQCDASGCSIADAIWLAIRRDTEDTVYTWLDHQLIE